MKTDNKPANLALPKKAVSKPAKVTIHQLPTGVRGLDDILGGGIPEFSFNIIGGTPGCGKTTMAHQIAFANATPKKPACLPCHDDGKAAFKLTGTTCTRCHARSGARP